MLEQALFAYIHYLSIIGLLCTLVLEWVLFNNSLDAKRARWIQKADTWYGITAILVLVTGFIRVFYYGKGYDYYFDNWVFLLKLSLFIIIGLLSIYPTVAFLKWRKELKAGAERIETDPAKANRIRWIIRVEVILAFLLPLLASMMARGIGS